MAFYISSNFTQRPSLKFYKSVGWVRITANFHSHVKKRARLRRSGVRAVKGWLGEREGEAWRDVRRWVERK